LDEASDDTAVLAISFVGFFKLPMQVSYLIL